MKVVYSKSYKKSFKKLDKKVKIKAIEKIEQFLNDPFEKSLNNHALNWKLKEFRSINITGDYRAIFRVLSGWVYELIEFIYIGSHSQLY